MPIRTPAIDLAEVGAGGGSVAWLDPAGALRVGVTVGGRAFPGPVARPERPVERRPRGDRLRLPPPGRDGGPPGRLGGFFKRHLDGTVERLASKVKAGRVTPRGAAEDYGVGAQ
ncbi:hydantoinase/oxoprolinase family protein [Nonomuraea sp. B5E05]|uniref:hydantoinase/oxoprolinase family protein n=1 Tax=Nonomuraea sp. B5E05 TaxID=3153569 RepID=UPI003261C0E8